MNAIPVGRLLRSNTAGCEMGCRVDQASLPAFGEMMRIALQDGTWIYGLVHDIHIDDDGLVRQLVSGNISPEILEDNRRNRNVPIEMSLSFIGWMDRDGRISQTRVPHPPLALDEIYPCTAEDILRFIGKGHPGYLRALLRNEELPAADLVAAHLRQVISVLSSSNSDEWLERYIGEVVALLKDDYPQLMDILTAVSDSLE